MTNQKSKVTEKDKNYIAPKGAIWVCGACGKTAKYRYGDNDGLWDASCFLNAVLCDEDSLEKDKGGRVITAEPFKESK